MRASVGWVLAVLTAAIVWMPAAAVARESARSGLPEARRVYWAVHPLRLPELASPVAFDDLPLSERARRLLFDEPERPFLKSLYLGLGGLGLVLAALGRGPALTPRSPWLIAGGGCLLVSLGPHTPVYSALVRLAPPLAMFRYPSKAMVGVALGWAVLCALGVDALRSGPPPAARPSWRLCLAVGIGALLIVGAFGGLLFVDPERLSRLGVLPGLVLEELPGRELGLRILGSALGGALVLACVASRAGASVPGQLLAASAVILDLALATRGVNRHAPRSLIAFRPPLVDAIKTSDLTRVYVYDYGQSPGKARRYLGRDFALVAAAGGSDLLMHELAAYEFLPPPLAGRWGIEGSYDLDLRGLQPRLLADLDDLLRRVEGSPLHLRLLRMGAVSRVAALHTANLQDLVPLAEVASLLPEPIKVFAVPGSLPRTYAVGQAILRYGPDEIRAVLQPDFDPACAVVVSGAGSTLGAGPFEGTSTILAMKPDEVAIDASLSREGWVVLVDAYDPGWAVTVDGAFAPLLRANAVFRAVAVPPGRHRIEMRYRPWAVAVGSMVSGGALLVVLALIASSVFIGRARG